MSEEILLTLTQKKVLGFIIKTFTDNDIEFQATGGLAAIAYGAVRPLYDIDIDIYKKDVEKIRTLLKNYIVEDWNNEIKDDDDNIDLWMMSLEIEGVSIDISQMEESRVRGVVGEWVNQPEKMNTQLLEIEGIIVPIQNKNDLIAYKNIIARDTDLADIQMIEKF